MMSESADEIGYAAAADSYWQAGWRGVLPLDHKAKVWPPSVKCADAKKPGHNKVACQGCISYTGHHGVDPSYADIMAWCEQYHNGNLCLRLPNNETIAVVGIDVDNYGAKTGGPALAEAIRRWGPLPETVRSTSREDDPISGIRMFRVPPGTMLREGIEFPELGVGDIEVCQFHHRYVLGWPSIHPEGRPYWWRNDAMQLVGIPVPEELVWLPQPWIDGLKVTPRSELILTGDLFNVVDALTPGDPSNVVRDRLTQAIKELNLPGQSRHDITRRHVMAILRLGKSGNLGVKQALQLLCEVFVAARQVDHSDSPEGARAEFVRMIDNDNAARELSAPGPLDWFNNLIVDETPNDALTINKHQSGTPDHGLRVDSPAPPNYQPTDNSAPSVGVEGAESADTSGGVAIHNTRPASPLEGIERGFWQSRESLSMIYTTALARMCPPWAVLAHTAARALTQVRPHVTLPPLIGGKGSLNWFAAVVAASGGGKGASSACAKLLVPDHIEARNIGSGEGIVAAFGRPGDDGDPSPVHEALLFTADEVDTLAAMNQRTASTTLSILRSGFSGETLGFSYAAREKRRHIGSHTYRMTLIVSIQPTRAGWLLADESGGTPQRFMWFPGTDSRIAKKRPWETGPLILPALTEWQYPRELEVPLEAADLILDERVKAMQGDQSALDGHALYCREKFAYALAVLDGRVEMTSEDWELSGIAADVSTYTRAVTVDTVKTAASDDAAERGALRGVENEAADVEKAVRQIERGQRVLRWLLTKLSEIGEDGATLGELKRRATSRDRGFVEGALQRAAAEGLVDVTPGTDRWYKR